MQQQTKVTKILSENKLSHLIEVETFGIIPKKFHIPVMDVRDGEEEREIGVKILKTNNTSKFLKPSYGIGGNSYQQSYKKSK